MKVVSYLKGIPGSNKNPEKPEVLKRFVQGVQIHNDVGIAHDGGYVPSDVAVLQGYVHEDSPNTPHLILRKQVLDEQARRNRRTIIVDSNLFLYLDKQNTQRYLRYSMDGVFPTTGNYFDEGHDPNRWTKISKELDVKLQPWRNDGAHILVCCQRNGGWSMQGTDVMSWCKNVIARLSAVTDRPIVVRAHPGDKNAVNYLKLNFPNVKTSFTPNITDDLKDAWCVITHNSSPGVAAAIEGIPVYVLDTNTRNSQAYEIANTDLKNIENPMMPERQEWIEKISMSHWNFEELKSGKAWAHMRKYI